MFLNCGAGEDSWVPWTARRSNQLILKEISPKYSLEGLMLKLKATWCIELTHWKRLMLGKIEGKRRRRWQRMRWMASLTQWTWVSANLGRWWRTGEPGVLQFTGLQRVGLDLTEEQQQCCSLSSPCIRSLELILANWNFVPFNQHHRISSSPSSWQPLTYSLFLCVWLL